MKSGYRFRHGNYAHIRAAMRRVPGYKIPRLKTLIRHGLVKKLGWGLYQVC
jgi:hypothetical protein